MPYTLAKLLGVTPGTVHVAAWRIALQVYVAKTHQRHLETVSFPSSRMGLTSNGVAWSPAFMFSFFFQRQLESYGPKISRVQLGRKAKPFVMLFSDAGVDGAVHLSAHYRRLQQTKF